LTNRNGLQRGPPDGRSGGGKTFGNRDQKKRDGKRGVFGVGGVCGGGGLGGGLGCWVVVAGGLGVFLLCFFFVFWDEVVIKDFLGVFLWCWVGGVLLWFLGFCLGFLGLCVGRVVLVVVFCMFFGGCGCG